MSTPKFEIFDDGGRKGGKLVIDRHVNYEYRYQLTGEFITGERDVWFYPVQQYPSQHQCDDGKCTEDLCNLPDTRFTTDVFEWTQHWTDPNPLERKGQKVTMDENRVVSFVTAEEKGIDMNWKRLRMMAQPIVDEQLGKLAMDQQWRTNPMSLSLGVMVVDTEVVRIDEASYGDMHAYGSATDMNEIEKAWKGKDKTYAKKKRVCEGLDYTEDGKKKPKLSINGFTAHGHEATNLGLDYSSTEDEKENKVNGKRDEAKTTVESANGRDNVVDEDVGGECKDCCKEPCVWKAKRDQMIDFDDDEHSHLPEGAGPPNNIRRKKVYRQMVLTMNEGGTGKGVRVALPKCVENGVRKLFPSPTFMGFKAK